MLTLKRQMDSRFHGNDSPLIFYCHLPSIRYGSPGHIPRKRLRPDCPLIQMQAPHMGQVDDFQIVTGNDDAIIRLFD
jgi:hypothetical protein